MTKRLRRTLIVATVAGAAGCGADANQSSNEAAIVSGGFRPATTGCSMAHCSAQMSDLAALDAPRRGAVEVWRDAAAPGARLGLGCVSNGRRAACTYDGGTLIVYDGDGRRRWQHSGFDAGLWKSAAMIDARGGVIVADRNVIVRFSPNGSAAASAGGWLVARREGGDPISPVMVGDKVILLATQGGPLATYDARNGNRLDVLDLGADTINTPGISTNHRAYIATDDGQGNGALRAIDVDPNTGAMTDAWGTAGSFQFLSASQASPLIIGDHVYFDGHKRDGTLVKRSYAFCIRDSGPRAVLVWQRKMSGEIAASMARDPRGGVWVYGFGSKTLLRVEEVDANQNGKRGEVVQTLDLDALVAQPGVHGPASAITIAAGTSFYDGTNAPVMLVNAAAMGSTYVTAIDLRVSAPSLLWKVKVSDGINQDVSAGQFPIVRNGRGQPTVVFASSADGARGVALP